MPSAITVSLTPRGFTSRDGASRTSASDSLAGARSIPADRAEWARPGPDTELEPAIGLDRAPDPGRQSPEQGAAQRQPPHEDDQHRGDGVDGVPEDEAEHSQEDDLIHEGRPAREEEADEEEAPHIPKYRGTGLLALPEIVALLDAVVLGQVDREVLTWLDRHLEAPLRVGPDRVGEFVGAGRHVSEPVVPSILGLVPAAELPVPGARDTRPEDPVP